MTSDVREKPAFQSYPVSGFSLTYNNTQRFDINNWVQVLTGCTEDSLLRPEVRGEVFKLKEMVDVPGLSRKAPHLVIQNLATSAESDAGHMVLASIKELQTAARAVAAQDPSPVKKPKIIIDVRLDDGSLQCVDVSVLQCAKENKDCMFQAASNFNGVECISEGATPDTPFFTTYYFHDRTQGPAASISAGSAALARVHAAFYDKDTDPQTWGQTASRQIEMLGDVSEYYNVINGYVCNTSSTKLLPTNPEEVQAIEEKVKVLLHAGIDAMYGRYDYSTIDKCDPQSICQTYCAALNLGQGKSGWVNSSLPDSQEKAKLLLRAAYRGTLYGAEMYKCKKVFLTLIGGGVFHNEQSHIIEAIAQADAELCQFNKFVEEIHIVFFRAPILEPIKAILNKYPIPWKVYTYRMGRPFVTDESNDAVTETSTPQPTAQQLPTQTPTQPATDQAAPSKKSHIPHVKEDRQSACKLS